EPAGPGFLVERARPRADHGLLRLTVLEEDRGRDREDAVARRVLRVLVDVHLGEKDLVLVARELLEDRRDGPARAAPGSPEVDDDGLRGLEDLLLERVVGDLLHPGHSTGGP